jgi:single-strand DNA-binding protein
MQSLNKFLAIGRLAGDPEQTETKSGKTRVTFPLAMHREQTSDDVKQEVIDYHLVVAWGELGAACAKHLRRGEGVYVEGTVLVRAYKKDGERRYVTEIRADEVKILSWSKHSGAVNLTIKPISPIEVGQATQMGTRSNSSKSDGKDE